MTKPMLRLSGDKGASSWFLFKQFIFNLLMAFSAKGFLMWCLIRPTSVLMRKRSRVLSSHMCLNPGAECTHIIALGQGDVIPCTKEGARLAGVALFVGYDLGSNRLL